MGCNPGLNFTMMSGSTSSFLRSGRLSTGLNTTQFCMRSTTSGLRADAPDLERESQRQLSDASIYSRASDHTETR